MATHLNKCDDVSVYFYYKMIKFFTIRNQREKTANVSSRKYKTKSLKQDHRTLEIYVQRQQVF